MKATQKLGNPVFIVSVLILVLNDWYLKQAFANGLTGKLSDFAGLFAFPFLLSALLPRKALKIYILTAILFIFWKSTLIQPLINAFNHWDIPINRTVDYTDYWALTILPLSLYIFHKSPVYRLKPVFLKAVMVFFALAFMATSMPPGKMETITGINKTYSFNFSKRELIARVNMLQLEYVGYVNKYGNAKADFDAKNNMFYYQDKYFHPDKKDTIAQILDYEKLKNTDTVRLRTLFANVNISGNEQSSEMKLLSVRWFVKRSFKGDAREKVVGIFEKNVVKKIRSYR